ncbi:DUF397 domain-containing protein [Saccharopolyspora sp. MS10]|uniref:DUF397 domain-containing protein n=1 Tax=Saccharopolyspora sp. MS10 TaxID=3385973 RepID=UPI0039A1ACDE
MHATDPQPQTPLFPQHGWTRSHRCGPNGGNCVEVNRPSPSGPVGVRDSKNLDDGVLIFDAARWRSFLIKADTGAFDLP